MIAGPRSRSLVSMLALCAALVSGGAARAIAQTPAQADAPARYWCPMHPNVRGADPAAKCNECGMALVAIPDRTGAGYWLDVTTQPAAIPVGRPVRVRLVVRDRDTQQPVAHFDEMHERLLHLFIVSRDLQYFEHVHPSSAGDGTFEVAVALPRPGAYRLVADLLPTGGTPQTLQHTLVTTRQVPPMDRIAAEPSSDVLEAMTEGVRARLVIDGARAGDDAHVRVELADAATGAPIADVEPYLGAWGHMFAASRDLAEVAHSHPLLEETTPGGPAITFQALFARGGWYRVWTQVQRRGRVLTFAFTLRVAPPL